MKQRQRIYYSDSDGELMWDRWQKGDSMRVIAGVFGRGHSSKLVLQILLNPSPFVGDDTIEGGISNAPIWHDHVIPQYAFFLRAQPKYGFTRFKI